MRFDKYLPSDPLKPYIKYFVVSENAMENQYKVFPSTGLVMGFQYKGKLTNLKDYSEIALSSAGITGISDGYKIFKNSADTGTVLVYFTETGYTHFASHPANELFNLSISLEDVFCKNSVIEVKDKLGIVNTDKERIKIIEQFLVSQQQDIVIDKLIIEAIRLIYETNGTIRIKELLKNLFISQSAFEKRFRKVVGTTAKKFASIVRFNAVIDNLKETKLLTEVCISVIFSTRHTSLRTLKSLRGKPRKISNACCRKTIFYNYRGFYPCTFVL